MNVYQGIGIIICLMTFAIFILRDVKQQKTVFTLSLIIVLAVILRVIICGDLYLHDWDERFHALVAKNILESPFSPKLYLDPLTNYNYKDWSANHVWLSKPILTFWIMGGSIFMFGTNELAVRLPSILISSFSVLFTFKIGKLLFNKRVGLLAAFFHAIHGMSLEQVGGKVSSDHVDVLFLFLFQICMYFVIKLLNNNSKSNNKKFLIYISLFFSLAFLTKWIMAFFILIIFGILHLITRKEIGSLLKDSAIIFFISGLIISPWIIYLNVNHPTELSYMVEQIFFPIKSPIQGHDGNWFYYINQIRIIFGELIYLPLIWLIYITIKKSRYSVTVISVWIFVPLMLLSLCGTKRDSYLMMCSVPLFILLGYFIHFLIWNLNKFKLKKLVVVIVLLLILLPIRYSLERLKPFELKLTTPPWKNEMTLMMDVAQKSAKEIIIINEPNYLSAMFYFNCVAYKMSPTEKELLELSSSHAIFENVNGKYRKLY